MNSLIDIFLRGHFEFRTLWSPTIVRLVSAAVPQVQELRKNCQLPQATPEALLFFSAPIEREEIARKSKVKQPWHWNSIHQIAFDNVKTTIAKEN